MKRHHIIVITFLIVTSILIVANLFSDVCNQSNNHCQPVVPPTQSPQIILEIAATNTISDWLTDVAEQFNSEGYTTSAGEIIRVNITSTTSGEAQSAILSGTMHPDVWIAGDPSWTSSASEIWTDLNRESLIVQECAPTVSTPIGLAMWQPMAEVLGYPNPVNIGALIEISLATDGWGMVGHPEWGNFKFGHTHPDYSDDGLLALSFISYRILEKLEGVTPEEIYSDISIEALYVLQQNTYHYGIETSNLLELMATRGPQYLHAVTATEADVLRANAQYGDQLRFPLVFVYPQIGTFWSEHPYCVLNTEWVADSETDAANIFSDYLRATEQQTLAMSYYLRPTDPEIELVEPFTLENGTNPAITRDVVPVMEPPSAGVAFAIRDIFQMTKKPATIILALDTSGSMDGEKMRNAANSAADFILRLSPRDEVYVLGFSDNVVSIGEGGQVSDVGESLSRTVRNVFADGGTALYRTVCDAVEEVDSLRTVHESQGIRHLYGIVVLSDGQDTASDISENQMYDCLPSAEDVEGVNIYTIGYGDSANAMVLTRIANRTNGHFYYGNENDIEEIYVAISAEQ
jgi:Ca-activated chloride channel homolog